MIINYYQQSYSAERFNADSTQIQRRLTTVPLQSSAARGVGGASPAVHDWPLT